MNNNLESGGGVESMNGFKIRASRDTQASEEQYESRKTWDGFRSRLPRAKVKGGLAGVATGPLDSFISFNQRYVLRLMVWTFLLGFAWATITWLARVTQGAEHNNDNNAHVWDYYHANIGEWTAPVGQATTNTNINFFVIEPEERRTRLSWDRKWTIDMVGTNGRGVYFTTLDWNQAKMGTEAHMMSNTVFESDWEPTVVKTNGRWRITFKP